MMGNIQSLDIQVPHEIVITQQRGDAAAILRSISKWLERAGPLNGKNSKNVVARDERGRRLKGFSGGPGRPLGSRNKLSEDFLRD
jgi:hypothetical protein